MQRQMSSSSVQQEKDEISTKSPHPLCVINILKRRSCEGIELVALWPSPLRLLAIEIDRGKLG